MTLASSDRFYRNSVIRQFLQRVRGRSPWHADHSARVSVYAVATGHALGLDERDLQSLYYSASLHALGILYSDCDPRRPLLAVQAIAQIDWLRETHDAMLYNREHWDGSGYPLGLKGKEIPRTAQIVGVSRYFDELTMPEEQNAAIHEAEAIAAVIKLGAVWFDPEVVAAFIKTQPIIQPVGL